MSFTFVEGAIKQIILCKTVFYKISCVFSVLKSHVIIMISLFLLEMKVLLEHKLDQVILLCFLPYGSFPFASG